VDHTADSPIFETGVSDKLTNDVIASDTTIVVDDGDGFLEGQVLLIGREKILVTSVSGDELEVERGYDDTKARDHAAGAPLEQVTDVLGVKRGVEDTDAQSHDIKTTVFEVGNEVTVERGTFGTQAAEHEAGTQVFNGPITPPDTITGGSEGYPPCGQLPAQTGGGGGGTEVEVSGTAQVSLNDNFFDSDGNQNPNFKIAAATPVTFSLANNGAAPHNMRIAGADGEFDTDDDVVSDPALIPAGGSGTVEFTAPAGTYDYECEFHPDQMNGQIIAE
jgi:plastocyanin